MHIANQGGFEPRILESVSQNFYFISITDKNFLCCLSRHALVSLLDEARKGVMLNEKIAMLSKLRLSIIDETGCQPISTENVDLLF